MALKVSPDSPQQVDQSNVAGDDPDRINSAKSLLLAHNALPLPEDFASQSKMFDAFSKLILGPFCEVRKFGDNRTLYGYESVSEEGHLLLTRVGSHGLGIWNTSDPMSCLCFGSISKSMFCSLTELKLQWAESDGQLRILKRAVDPENHSAVMFQVDWQGSLIGLHYCFLGPYGMDRWHDLIYGPSHEVTLPNEALSSLNACKDMRYIHDSVANFEKFKIIYRVLELWSRHRGIYSERLGYLSREHIVLLLNRLWKIRRLEQNSVPFILNTFFVHYSTLNWEKEIIVDPDHDAQDRPSYHRNPEVAVVICSIFPPVRNIASSVSKNSLRIILKEFIRATNLTRASDINWLDLVGLQGVTEPKNSSSLATAEFVQHFNLFIRFDMRYWGSNMASRIRFLDSMEMQYASLFRKLTDLDFKFSLRRSDSLAFAWPYHLRDTAASTEMQTSFYLIGIEYNGADGDQKPFMDNLRRECEEFVHTLRQGGVFDPTTGWVNISVIGRGNIGEIISDGGRDDVELSRNTTSGNVETVSLEVTNKRKGLTNDTTDQLQKGAHNKLRPAADVLNRLIWDPGFDRKDYIIGYDDRFSGSLEMPLDSWKGDPTDEEFIPQHRILYFKRKADNDIIWERRTRIDKIFVSRNSAPTQ